MPPPSARFPHFGKIQYRVDQARAAAWSDVPGLGAQPHLGGSAGSVADDHLAVAGAGPQPGLQVLEPDRLADPEGVQAGAFLGLQLEQLQQAHRLARGGHQPQAARGRDQHHPGGRDAEQVDAPVRQSGQQSTTS